MSGYAALARFDAAPLDPTLLDTVAASLRFRGPDRQDRWTNGPVALAHALMATSAEEREERQPFALGALVIAGDIRVDARADFAAALRAPADASDPELVLRGYAAWGESVLDRLAGDFSFAVWDGERRRLFCARDRFARRPLFYAHHDGALIVTNNLPTLLALPGLAGDLDEAAVADFLLFGRNLHAERTTFARIARVPAAHRLVGAAQGVDVRRYWSIPMRDAPRRISEADAQAEFRHLLEAAVMDRARADRIVLSLSGGLDSNAVAATLTRNRTGGVVALTTVFRSVFEDEEGRYATLAANGYGIPIELQEAGRCVPFAQWEDPRVRGLEPTDEPCAAGFLAFLARAAAHGRVVMTGEGGDPALYTSHDYFARLLARLRWIRFVRDASYYAVTRRKRPPLLLRSRLLRLFGVRRAVPAYPDWIDHQLERKLDLRGRWEEIYGPPREPRHPYRAEAWHLIDSASWARTFEATDAGATGAAVEWVSPYFDVRLIEFLFSLPPMPHFADKDIVRQSMAGRIPDAVRLRPKTPLPVDPSALAFRRQVQEWVSTVQSAPELGRFVRPRALADAILSGGNEYRASQHALGVSLALWLRYRKRP